MLNESEWSAHEERGGGEWVSGTPRVTHTHTHAERERERDRDRERERDVHRGVCVCVCVCVCARAPVVKEHGEGSEHYLGFG